jgi:methionyl-tRNA synthetase
MPQASAKMATALGLSVNDPQIADFRHGARWGLSVAGTQLQKTDALFPRMDTAMSGNDVGNTLTTAPQKNMASTEDSSEPKKKAKVAGSQGRAAESGVIEFSQFQQLDLRVAEVVRAERIAKSDRLLKLTVTAPEERTIVAGIAEYYTPEELPGRLVLIVANLKPVELMGVQSQGMVLAAHTLIKGKKRLVLTTVSGPAPVGSKVA